MSLNYVLDNYSEKRKIINKFRLNRSLTFELKILVIEMLKNNPELYFQILE